jgi:cysteine desulfurase
MPSGSLTYLDNNATTRLDPRVLETMLPFLTEHWGNPSSLHGAGRPVAKAVSAARRKVADCLRVLPGEVVFTGGGTEADNLALRGAILAMPAPRQLITTAVEHPAVLETCKDLAARGLCQLHLQGVDGEGRLDVARLQEMLGLPGSRLLSIMWANNETGVRFPIEEIVDRVHSAGAVLHVDAVQAVGKEPLDLATLPIDLVSLSAHKFHGPKGVGALIVRRGAELQPACTGGGQERGRRSGTENPAGIAGLAHALELAVEEQGSAALRMRALRDRLEHGLRKSIDGLRVTGEGAPRLCNTSHVTLPRRESEAVLLQLDREGIACSVGSACSTGALEPSHVLRAMGVPAERLHGALRFSLSRESSERDVDQVLRVLPSIVRHLDDLFRSRSS